MIRALTLRRYLELMRLRGFSTDQVLAGTGVDAERLLDKAYLVDLDARKAVISNMLALTGNPALGLEFGRATRIAQMGAIGHALLSSHSIWEQYRLWLQYGEPLLGLPIAVRIVRHVGGHWSAIYSDPISAGPEHVFCVEELLMFSNKMTEALTGEPLRLKGLKLDYPEPAHSGMYADIFRCPIEFGAARVELMAVAPFPEDIFPGQEDEEFAATALNYCGRLLAEGGSAVTVAARLHNTFAANLGQLPSIEESARIMGMSERTLRRRLADENTGFQEVFNKFRHDTAIDYLR